MSFELINKKKREESENPNRFWEKVNITGLFDCWNWKDSPTCKRYGKGRYGSISINNKRFLAHRIAYELSHEKIPEGVIVIHTCDNGLCCNPAHLRLGTYQDNTDDMFKKNRQRFTGAKNPAKGKQLPITKLEEYQVKEIINLFKTLKSSDIAKIYNVSPRNIRNILHNDTWKYIERT